MARPTKLGLEYFSMDVDLFDDEKVIPISTEFGAKGECVLIRVLCAIYRNGYFAECSEAFKFKIAKQANVPASLVGEVIAGLVKWGFFDKSVFDSFSVITSKGIQKRWKEATRKRVNKKDLDFWILEYPAEVTALMAEETSISGGRSTQSKVKESKVKESSDIDRSRMNEEVQKRMEERVEIPMLECRSKFMSDIEHIRLLSGQLKVTETTLSTRINEYFNEQIGRGFMRKSVIDAKSHFFNWHNKKYPYGGTQQQIQQTATRTFDA